MATRSKRFAAGVLTGYGSLVINIGFTLISIPLALRYLDKEQFGLWSLALQINGYLALIDLGMNAATSRYLADHKDHVEGGEYGSYLRTGAMVFLVQGLLVALVGGVLAWLAPTLFKVSGEMLMPFRLVLLGLAGITGMGIAFRSLAAPLWAFQRSDVINMTASASLITTLALLWAGFHGGLGIYSFLLAQGAALLQSLLIYGVVCRRNGYYPPKGAWGLLRKDIFRKIFHFGTDSLLINIGNQLVNATHLLVIGRCIGIEGVTIYSISTKFFTMVVQFVNNPISAAASPLTEMQVRGEHERFRQRYWDLITMCLAIGTLGAVGLAAGNRSVVGLWTGGEIEWTWVGDLMFGLLVILKGLNGNFIGMFGILKNWKPVKWILVIEGLVFIPLAVAGAKWFGVTGTLVAAMVANLSVSTLMSFREAKKVIGSWKEHGPNLWTPFLLVGISSVWGWWSQATRMEWWLTLPVTGLLVMAAAAMIWKKVFHQRLRDEVSKRLEKVTGRFRRKAATMAP